MDLTSHVTFEIMLLSGEPPEILTDVKDDCMAQKDFFFSGRGHVQMVRAGPGVAITTRLGNRSSTPPVAPARFPRPP